MTICFLALSFGLICGSRTRGGAYKKGEKVKEREGRKEVGGGESVETMQEMRRMKNADE